MNTTVLPTFYGVFDHHQSILDSPFQSVDTCAFSFFPTHPHILKIELPVSRQLKTTGKLSRGNFWTTQPNGLELEFKCICQIKNVKLE